MKFFIIFIFIVLFRTIIGLNIENYCHPLELKCPNNCISKLNEKKSSNFNYRCEPNLCTAKQLFFVKENQSCCTPSNLIKDALLGDRKVRKKPSTQRELNP